MRLQILLILFVLFKLPIAFSQQITEKINPGDNQYRSDKNPYYWQNRKPDAAYWQQDVQ